MPTIYDTEIVPLRDYILVAPDVREQSKILWTANYEKFCQGTIVKVGEGVRSRKDGTRIGLTVSVGDRIKYGNGTYLDWTTYLDRGRTYQLIREQEICGVMEDGKEQTD